MSTLLNTAENLRRIQDSQISEKLEKECDIVAKEISSQVLNRKEKYVRIWSSNLSKETVLYLKNKYKYIIGKRQCGINEYEYIVSWFEEEYELKTEFSDITIL